MERDILRRFSTEALVAGFAAGLLGIAILASSVANSAGWLRGHTHTPWVAEIDAQVGTPGPVDFGSPPGGIVPIIFNDRHVYATPDTLRSGRVLAALIRHGYILVPLRSLFAQMGASVAWDPPSKTVDVYKQGSDVRVQVGVPEVWVNNEQRPLDVPPVIYRGRVLVPLRVLSEGMGAYVQWNPSTRTVVIRYLSTAPIPTPPPVNNMTPGPGLVPTPVPTFPPVPTPPPARAPHVRNYEAFIIGDYLISPRTYNEWDPGNHGKGTLTARLAVEFPLLGIPWMLEGDYRDFQYPHASFAGTGACPSPIGDPGCVNQPGGGQAYVPGYEARDQNVELRAGIRIFEPRIYIGFGYLFRSTNYSALGGVGQQHGPGFGLEKLPDLDRAFSIYGSAYYYPEVTTAHNQTLSNGTTDVIRYKVLTYELGGKVDIGKTPLYLDLGFLGDHGYNKQNAPGDFTHSGPYIGLGIHFK